MPELVTHTCAAFLARAPWPGRMLPVFVAGATLPDLLSRLPSMGLLKLQGVGLPVPEVLFYAFTPAHLPAGILLWSLCLTLLFPPIERRAVLANLLAGGTLHMFMDLGQYHHGTGYPLLYPFSTREFELGIFGSEATVLLAPWLAVATAAIYLGRHLWRRRRSTMPGNNNR